MAEKLYDLWAKRNPNWENVLKILSSRISVIMGRA